MPSGPGGEKGAADVISSTVHVVCLWVGLESEPLKEPSGRVRSGQIGPRARAEKLTAEKRQTIARYAAQKRWE
jgi:hypothetical protein